MSCFFFFSAKGTSEVFAFEKNRMSCTRAQPIRHGCVQEQIGARLAGAERQLVGHLQVQLEVT